MRSSGPHRRRSVAAVATILLLFASPAFAKSLLDTSATDWVALIGPPPKPDSATAREDLASLLWVQRTRSEADVERVWAAMSPAVGTFQQAVGTMLLPQSYPKLHAAVGRGLDAATPVYARLKSQWDRPRPEEVDDRVKPCTPTPGSGSYPSGTATLGVVAARLLADLLPERKKAILARGNEIAELRVLAGVHFPSDVEAGTKLGTKLADEILASEAWAQERKNVAGETKDLRRRLSRRGD